MIQKFKVQNVIVHIDSGYITGSGLLGLTDGFYKRLINIYNDVIQNVGKNYPVPRVLVLFYKRLKQSNIKPIKLETKDYIYNCNSISIMDEYETQLTKTE